MVEPEIEVQLKRNRGSVAKTSKTTLFAKDGGRN
jgi:hypothetical protein